jgi:hypothetical protein
VPYLNFESSYIIIKHMSLRPVPAPIMAELKKYVSGLDSAQEKIFVDCFNQYRRDKIREKLGLDDFTFHGLRNCACAERRFHGCHTEAAEAFFTRSNQQSVYEC